MNSKILYLINIAWLVCILGGCAYTTETVKLDYTPSHYTKITDATKTIEVNRLKDMRGVDPKLLSYKGTAGKTTGSYVSEREVSDIVTDAIKNLLTNQNYRIVNDKGMLTLTGEILKFESYVLMGFWSGQIEGNIQVNLRLIDNKNGNIMWNEIFSGNGKKTGLQIDREGHRKEVLEKTLDNLMLNISNSTSFKKAIERLD
jgi:uncharacterized lipoprotein YajG